MKNTIILASDHAGFALKEVAKKFLESKSEYSVIDVGAHEYVEGDDYPEYMAAAAMKVATDQSGATKAVIFGKSGQGEAIVANRFPGVRAIVYYGGDPEILKLSRQHNDANILSIGAGFVSEKEIGDVIETWLTTPFGGDERHVRRNAEIDAIQ